MFPSSTTEATKGEIVDYGTDKDSYTIGDTFTAWISIKNTSDKVIENGKVNWNVKKVGSLVPIEKSGTTNIKDVIKDFSIASGQTRKFERTDKVQKPDFIPDFVVKGKWDVKAEIYLDDSHIGDIEKTITLNT